MEHKSPPESPLNVSPQYGLYDRKSSVEAIAERRLLRQQSSLDPVAQIAQISTRLERLRLNQENDQAKIAELEAFRAGMNGDENIRVADNKITWVGRVAADLPELVTVDYCDGGDPFLADIPMANIRPA